ncbi:MAG TPA: hypothetical protein VMW41_00545 [Candidatus Bathyarchaeia archaeon]|nr:hypothetical protein [Candidatus Bathyarchaeia archaeon]
MSKNNKNKKDKAKDVVKELGLPVAGAVISVFSPFVGIGTAAASGIWSLVDKWRGDRIKEVKNEVGAKKLLELIQRDDKAKDILHKILLNVLQEESRRKRRLYYNYISQLHKDIYPSFDYHSKIILTINSITFDELHRLAWLNEKYDGILRATLKRQKKENPEAKINVDGSRGISIRDVKEAGYLQKREDEIDLEDKLARLGNYGLISVKNGRYGGTFFGPLTEFGEKFLEFIKKDR